MKKHQNGNRLSELPSRQKVSNYNKEQKQYNSGEECQDRQLQSDDEGQYDSISRDDQHSSANNDVLYEIQTHRLPQLSEVINMKFKHEDKDLHNKVIDIVRYAQNLENIVKYKNRQIERLQYLVKYLTIAQQKRDEMLSHIQEDNRKLKEQNAYLENVNKRPFLRVSQSAAVASKSLNQSPQPCMPSLQNNQLQTSRGHQHNSYQTVQSQNKSMTSNTGQKNQQQKSQKKTQNHLYDCSNYKKSEISNSSQRVHRFRPKEAIDEGVQTILCLPLESDIEDHYCEKDFVESLSGILQDEDYFVDQVKQLEYIGMISLFDSIQKLMTEHKSLFYLAFRLRKLLKASTTMYESRVFTEVLENIVDETCICLDSDRASVFIFEQESEQLWTKVAKGSNKTIKVPFDQGIVGAVFTSGEHLNILNAYNDERFNKGIDKAMNYKTNTILAYPIYDKDRNNVIGVIQAVNKLKGYFTKDDEGLMQILSQLASIVLRNSEQFDQTILFQNNLRNILLVQSCFRTTFTSNCLFKQTGISLSGCVTIDELIPKAEKKLQDLMNANRGKIFVIDENNQRMFSLHTDTKEKVYHSLTVGIAGYTYETGETLKIANAYNHHLFNQEIDIETSMPIISMPVRKDKNSNIIAVIQVINSRGIQGLSSTNKVHHSYQTHLAIQPSSFSFQSQNSTLLIRKHLNTSASSQVSSQQLLITFTLSQISEIYTHHVVFTFKWLTNTLYL